MDSKDATTRLTDVTQNADRGSSRVQVGSQPEGGTASDRAGTDCCMDGGAIVYQMPEA